MRTFFGIVPETYVVHAGTADVNVVTREVPDHGYKGKCVSFEAGGPGGWEAVRCAEEVGHMLIIPPLSTAGWVKANVFIPSSTKLVVNTSGAICVTGPLADADLSGGNIIADEIGGMSSVKADGSLIIDKSSGMLAATSTAGSIDACDMSGGVTLAALAGDVRVNLREPERATVSAFGNVVVSGDYDEDNVVLSAIGEVIVK